VPAVPTLAPILVALNEAGVRYVVVGGVAVVVRGYPRFTADLDLVVDLEPAEALKVISTLLGIGLRPSVPVEAEDFADPPSRRRWIEDKGMIVLSMIDPHDPLRHVDLFVEYPMPFEDLWAASDVLDLDGVATRTASIAHLIELKRAAARPKDLEDVDALRELLDNEPDA